MGTGEPTTTTDSQTRPDLRGVRAREAAWWAVPLALLLWQLPAEIGALVLRSELASEVVGWVPNTLGPAFLSLPGLAPQAGWLLAGLLVGLAALGVAVALGVRLVVDVLGSVVGFLASWMLVILAGCLSHAVVTVVLAVGQEGAMVGGFLFSGGAIWGVTFGWLVALAATWSGRRTRGRDAQPGLVHDPAPASAS
jgi:hypothetical protein